MKIELPYPPKELSPNGRSYYITKNKLFQQYKLIARLAAKNEKPKGHVPWKRATTQVTYFHPKKCRMDEDNALARLKAAFDGVALAGIIEDDWGFSHMPPKFEVDKERPRVTIEIHQIAEPT